METEADWLVSLRNEFPGLAAAQNWVLCDSPSGTQVHQVGEQREREETNLVI